MIHPHTYWYIQADTSYFSLVGNTANKHHLKLKESLPILKLKPLLNGAKRSMPLYLFGEAHDLVWEYQSNVTVVTNCVLQVNWNIFGIVTLLNFIVYIIAWKCGQFFTKYLGEFKINVSFCFWHLSFNNNSHIFKHLHSTTAYFDLYNSLSFKIIDQPNSKFDLKMK